MQTRRNILRYAGGTSLALLWGCNPPTEAGQHNMPPSANRNFFMPPEDAPHQRTFMQWPVMANIYGSRHNLKQVQDSIALIANTISAFEPVVMLAAENQKAELKKKLSNTIEHWHMPTEDLWCRDSGPSFVVSKAGALGVMDFNFNGWGAKQRHRNDSAIARNIAERMTLDYFDSGVTGEAGGLESDGAGTIIAHESSWVNANRNHLDRDEIERRLLAALGAQKVIWAPGLMGEDITDYHIDALARFVASGKILIQLPEAVDPDDPFSLAAYETFDILKNATDAAGNPFEIITIPDPLNIRAQSTDFVASYVNYYVCNGAVIAAEFGDNTADAHARATLEDLYPTREIVMLNIDPIGEAGGGIHCATQQQPKT